MSVVELGWQGEEQPPGWALLWARVNYGLWALGASGVSLVWLGFHSAAATPTFSARYCCCCAPVLLCCALQTANSARDLTSRPGCTEAARTRNKRTHKWRRRHNKRAARARVPVRRRPKIHAESAGSPARLPIRGKCALHLLRRPTLCSRKVSGNPGHRPPNAQFWGCAPFCGGRPVWLCLAQWGALCDNYHHRLNELDELCAHAARRKHTTKHRTMEETGRWSTQPWSARR